MDIYEILNLPSVALDERKHLPDCRGVYFAVIDRQEVAYIGSTESLRGRWRTHTKRRALSDMGDVRVYFLPVDDNAIENFIEQDAIEVFHPRLNGAPARWGIRPHPGTWLPAALGALMYDAI